MATLTTPEISLNKVVVAYLDGRRPRGCVYDFSPLKDTFRLVSEGAGQQQKGTEVALKDLKAVFFVKDFRGDSKHNESKNVPDGKPGRKIEVTFSDGEKVVAPRRHTTQKVGVSLFFRLIVRATVFASLW